MYQILYRYCYFYSSFVSPSFQGDEDVSSSQTFRCTNVNVTHLHCRADGPISHEFVTTKAELFQALSPMKLENDLVRMFKEVEWNLLVKVFIPPLPGSA